MNEPNTAPGYDRRTFLGGGAAAWALACAAPANQERTVAAPKTSTPRTGFPLLVGSANALVGMQRFYKDLADGGDPLDVAVEVCKVQEADPEDQSVGLGGLPNEDGVVQLDAACMYGPTHKSGAVACIENILHPSEVAKLVMQRTDHCLLVGKGAYEFARAHGFPHVELLTEASRKAWLEWKERLSSDDDWLQEREPPKPPKNASLESADWQRVASRSAWKRPTGTIHVSALSTRGEVACCTTTSGLAFKIPGRVGDSPIIGAGLYCDQECGSAGATGRGEASILANGSFAIVELLRQGAAPLDAAKEALRRVVRQAQRLSKWQPEMVDADGRPSFNLQFYTLDLSGRFAGVSLKGGKFAVADPERGPRHEELAVLDA
ncbi:MAG: N(4)-(beta-N-acetylglucosaminyl)-L-asparaginase [Planctomycetes bacterium]|nr:N(4)-(beta-N-acetylglucosaminyl)-L-asparaginase [Planctomycetota bacterium]